MSVKLRTRKIREDEYSLYFDEYNKDKRQTYTFTGGKVSKDYIMEIPDMLTTLFQHFYLYAPILTDHPIPAFYIFKYLKYSELNQIPKKYISIIVWWSAIPVLGGQ